MEPQEEGEEEQIVKAADQRDLVVIPEMDETDEGKFLDTHEAEEDIEHSEINQGMPVDAQAAEDFVTDTNANTNSIINNFGSGGGN